MNTSLIDKIVNGDFMSRDEQISQYQQYFDSSYNYDTREYDTVEMPDHLHIFWSHYTYEDYSGYGEVWGFNTDTQMFFSVSGSHCSCYGLEGQWDEEPYTYDEMVLVVDRRLDEMANTESYYYSSEKLEEFKTLLDIIKGEVE